MALPLSILIRFLLFTLFTFAIPRVNSQGLTLDACVTTEQCVSPRTCRTGSCLPPRPIRCLSDDACPEGERCFVLPNAAGTANRPNCASIQGARSSGGVRVTPPNPTGGGLTGAPCNRNDECRSPRACITIVLTNGGPELCVGRTGCLCAPPVFQECEADGDCPEGERCGFIDTSVCAVEGPGTGLADSPPRPTAVVDPDFVEDSIQNGREPNSATVVITREVCVAERHLEGVKGIYETGRLAHVLCDSSGSCATPGHLVVFHGKGMMMRRYCDVVGCAKDIMKVNSPRWERQLRVKSWSNGLEFTAFAARYETVAEEIVLVGAVRAGL